MPILLTKEALRKLLPRAPEDILDSFVKKQSVLDKAGISHSVNRLAYFFANISHETGGFAIKDLTENINYTAGRAAQIWPSRFGSASEVINRFGSAPGWQLKMFDNVYGNRMGNRPGTQDGSRYIGRGGPQWTGREGYEELQKRTGLPAVEQPDVAARHDVQPEVCAAFWSWKNLNPLADAGDFRGVVKRWNGGYIGIDDREAQLERMLPIIKSLSVGASAPVVPSDAPLPKAPVPAPVSDLASRILAAMTAHGYRIDSGKGELNIVYVEGMNADGTANDNKPNQFNDLRCVISADGKMRGIWQATTEPSRHWTQNPMNSGGAARIAFGQYRAWQVGTHNGSHEALVQTGGQVAVHRDLNKDFKRDGDKLDTGFFGINQHWGYDLPADDLGTSSAGCLVGRSKDSHRAFMALMKTDPRFVADRRFTFSATVMPAAWVIEAKAAPLPAPALPGAKTGVLAGIGGAMLAAIGWFDAHPGWTVAIGIGCAVLVIGVIELVKRNKS